MSSGVETAEIIEPFIYSTLAADAALAAAVGDQIYGPLTPNEVTGPYVTIVMLSQRDVRGVGQARFDTDSIYLVKAVCEATSQDAVLPAARRISTLLDGVNADTPNGHVTSTRETVVSYVDTTGGRAFTHLGATFRLRANS